MIIEYDKKYDEEIKNLLVQLQEYIVAIDKEKYNILTPEYKEKYFAQTLEEVSKYKGKILLFKENNKIVGLIIGLIDCEECNDYDFVAPKRGRISELIVSKESRAHGIGSKLLTSMEEYLKSVGCQDVLIAVFGYNDKAINFYSKSGYHTRMFEMTKKLNEDI